MRLEPLLLVVLTLVPILVVCEETEMDVSDYCIGTETYEVGRSDTYNLTWKGDFPKGKWFPCKFAFKPKDDGDYLCVTAETFVMPTYLTKLKYYRDDDSEPDKSFNAVTSPGTDDYCVEVDKLNIVFDCTGGIIRSEIAGSYVSLKVWSKEGNHAIGLIIGMSVLAVFIVCVVITVVIICKCYRRQGARGFIHHTLSEANAASNHQYPSAMVSPYGAAMPQTARYPITTTQTASANMPTMGVSAPYLAQDMYPVASPSVTNTDRPWPPQNQKI